MLERLGLTTSAEIAVMTGYSCAFSSPDAVKNGGELKTAFLSSCSWNRWFAELIIDKIYDRTMMAKCNFGLPLRA
jgi:hypothetical protein